MSKQPSDELRRRAEQQLAARDRQIERLERADLARVAHELAVHQIELEIQNEELRRTRTLAEEARDRYLDLYDFAPVGYFTLDEHLRIVEANLTGCRLLHTGRLDLLDRRFTKFLAEEETDKFYFHRKQTLEGGVRQTCELKMQRADGTVFDARLESIRAGEGRLRAAVIDVTERQRAEEALRASEEQFRAFFHIPAVGTAQLALDGRFLEVNDRLCQITGYSREELLRMAPADLTHPDDRRRADEFLSAYLQGLTPGYETEKRYVRKDGQVIWVQVTAALIRDAQGKPLRSAGVIQDITEHRQAEETLRESEAKYRRIVETATEGIVMADAEARMIFINDRWSEIFGYRPEEAKQVTLFDLVFPEDRAEMAERWESRKRGRKESYEFRFRRKDGRPVWLQVGVAPRLDPEGRFLGTLGMVTDISKRKRAEEALRELNATLESRVAERTAALRQKGAELREAQRIARIGSWYWDAQTDVTTGSDELLRIYGFDPATQSMPDFKQQRERCYPVEDWEAVNAAVQETLQTGVGYELDVRALRNGVPIWITMHGEATRDAEGRIVGLRGTVQDITGRKQAERTIRQANEALRHRARQLQKVMLELSQAEENERKRLAEILHDDLQQQLAAAKFHLSLLGRQVQEDVPLREEVDRAVGLLKDALDQSRSLSHELSPVLLYHGDFGEVLEWLANQMQAKHGLVVHVQAHGSVEVSSDGIKTLFFRAAQEILFNIVKHAGVTEATVRLRQRRGRLWMGICDRGRGFDPKGVKETAGFGLPSIRERVELLGGRMKIRSTPGRGSTFLIAVPDGTDEGVKIRTGEGWRPSVSHLPAVSPSDLSGGPRLRVLLVDDHKVVCEGLAAVLSREEDVEVVGCAAEGRQAVDLALELRPDVVLMDVSMPGMNGDEAARQIKTHVPQTRVVAFSMYDEPEKRKRMYQAGAEDYVLKSAESEELLAAIRGRASA